MMIWIVIVSVLCTVPTYSVDDIIQSTSAQNMQEDSASDIDFVALFGAAIEDGFFGGARWGIAAAFYHMLYSVVGLTLVTVPKTVSSLLRVGRRWRDACLGRAPLLEIHELQVLVGLLQDALKEYEQIDTLSQDDHFCKLLPIRTLSIVMQHIHEYVCFRSSRYHHASSREILFFLQFIAQTIDGIMNCIECVDYRAEIIGTTKTTLVIMNKLIMLLQGPRYERDLFDPTAAWFSEKRKLYVLRV